MKNTLEFLLFEEFSLDFVAFNIATRTTDLKDLFHPKAFF